MPLLCSAVSQLQGCANGTIRIENHLPREICNLSGSQASFHREQDDHAVSKRIPSRFGKQEEVVDLVSQLKSLPACPASSQSIQQMTDSTGCDEQCNCDLSAAN